MPDKEPVAELVLPLSMAEHIFNYLVKNYYVGRYGYEGFEVAETAEIIGVISDGLANHRSENTETEQAAPFDGEVRRAGIDGRLQQFVALVAGGGRWDDVV